MIFKDYYKILGLETNKVSVEEIKIAYREQAKNIIQTWMLGTTDMKNV